MFSRAYPIDLPCRRSSFSSAAIFAAGSADLPLSLLQLLPSSLTLFKYQEPVLTPSTVLYQSDSLTMSSYFSHDFPHLQSQTPFEFVSMQEIAPRDVNDGGSDDFDEVLSGQEAFYLDHEMDEGVPDLMSDTDAYDAVRLGGVEDDGEYPHRVGAQVYQVLP